MRAVIIAGGAGTRLRPLTYNTPKPMVPLFDKPFLQYQIELLKRHGITEIIVNLHYLSDSIREELGDGSRLGVKLFYSLEDKALGTAGAVKNAEEFFDDEPLLVFNGDILTDIDLSALIATHKQTQAKASLTLIRVEDPTAYGLILMEDGNRISRFLEKPSMEEAQSLKVDFTVNAGIYLLDPSVFRYVPKGEAYSFERGLFPLLLQLEERMTGHVTDAYWLDIGSPQKYMQAHLDVLQKRVKVDMPATEVAPNLWVGKDVDIDDLADVRGPVFLGNHAKVRKKAKIHEYSILGSHVIVDDRARLEHALIGGHSVVGEEAMVHRSIVGKNCRIGAHARIDNHTVLADDTILGRGTYMGS